MSESATDRLYTVSQALELMSIGRTFFYEEIKRGRISALKAGSRTLVPLSAINNWRSQLQPMGSQFNGVNYAK